MIMYIPLIISLSLLAAPSVADTVLWEKLQRDPNMVVLMRNAESSGNRDGVNMLVWDESGNCRGESTLTAEGKAHARKIGERFKSYGIEPTVISSPMCRCLETARTAFGEFVTDPALRQAAAGDSEAQALFQDRAGALLSQYRGQAPIVFVNHRPNIDALTMEMIAIGDLLVGSLSEEGEIEVLGRIRVEP